MPHVIYGLYDPTLPESVIRYVGYTSQTLDRRLVEHVCESAAKAKSHRHKWIRSLVSRGVKPAIVTLEIVTAETWRERECFWIASLLNLVNGTAGGEGLINPTQEVRDRISKSVSARLQGNQYRKGIAHTVESKAAIAAGMKLSAKFAAANAAKRGIPGHSISDESKEKIRQSKLGKKRPPMGEEWRANMRAAQLGRKHSAETKAKISAAQKGVSKNVGLVHTDSAREAIRASKLGSKWINDGVANKSLPAGSGLPQGWVFGRVKRSK